MTPSAADLAVARHADVIRRLLIDDVPPAVEDGRWLAGYIAAGEPSGPPIMLSLGESWLGPPPALRRSLSEAPEYVHGYQLSGHGLPELRDVLRPWLFVDHRVPESCWPDLGIAVAWSGTRAVMGDFGRLLRRQDKSNLRPVVLAPGPGWDYEGVFEPLGFEVAFYDIHLMPTPGVDLDALDGVLEKIDKDPLRRLALIVVNIQHNPSGIDLGGAVADHFIEAADARNAGILVDDAHYWMAPRDIPPTSVLALLAEKETAIPWVTTRSFGKQFGANGWGIGAVVGPGHIIDRLFLEIAPERSYNGGGLYQWALAQYIAGGDATRDSDRKRQEFRDVLKHVRARLVKDLGYPLDSLVGGDCTPFQLLPVRPSWISQGGTAHSYRRRIFDTTGVVLTDGWPLARPSELEATLPLVRMYLGSPRAVIDEALDRFVEYGWTYEIATQSVRESEGE